MAVTSGNVANLKVDKDYNFALFWIEEKDTGIPELFLLWEAPEIPFDSVFHSIWLSMLRDSIAHSLPVQVGHDEDSSIVTELLIARQTE